MINFPTSATSESRCEDCLCVARRHAADGCQGCEFRHCDGFLWYGVRYTEEVHPVTREMVKGRTLGAGIPFHIQAGRLDALRITTGTLRADILIAQDAVGSADDE